MKQITSQQDIEKRIFLIRGHRVMMDRDLAELYKVKTKVLIQAVKRNIDRFPTDFMLQLAWNETKLLRSQFVTLKQGRHLKYRPFAFTEQGIAMLSGVLRSKRAVQVNIAIMRAFVQLRQTLYVNKTLTHKLAELEEKIEKNDTEIQSIFEAIRQLTQAPEKPKRKIGFHP